MAACGHRMKQFHVKERRENVLLGRPRADLENLLNICTCRADVLHDLSNGGAWGVKEYAGATVLKSVFCGFRSARDCYSSLLACMHEWLREAVVFEDPPFTPATLDKLWLVLEVVVSS